MKERSERRTLERSEIFSRWKDGNARVRRTVDCLHSPALRDPHVRACSRELRPEILAEIGTTSRSVFGEFEEIVFPRRLFPVSRKINFSSLFFSGRSRFERRVNANERVPHDARNESTRQDSRRMLSRQRSRYCPAVEYFLTDPPGVSQARV